MTIKTLWLAGLKRHRGTLIGLFALCLTAMLCLLTALAVALNGSVYERAEMERLGYGSTTVWISGCDNAAELALEGTVLQPLIFVGYKANGTHSDDEGQLLCYDSERWPYQLINENGAVDGTDIAPGTIRVSPAMQSVYGLQIGDEITFELARDGSTAVFTVAGWFEDPFMGSSMIDMKSFLICQSDFDALTERLSGFTDFYRLGRTGYMAHLSGTDAGQLTRYAEFTYTAGTLSGFMLMLQNIVAGFLAGFALLLLLVTLIVAGHSLTSAIELDRKELGILKTIGLTGADLRRVQLLQYAAAILPGLILGAVLSIPAASVISRLMLTSTGLLIPGGVPVLPGLLIPLLTALLLLGFVHLKTAAMARVTPMDAILQRQERGRRIRTPLKAKSLSLLLAVRQVLTGRKRYAAVLVIAAILVFFAGIVARMNVWLGPNGEGLMDAFSVADHDIGIQPTRPTDLEEAEEVIASYAPILGKYEVAMQPVTVNGVSYTCNAVDQPERFHILTGRTCTADDEIVVTRFVAAELGVSLGDTVSVNGKAYTVVGTYQCANETGANIGMSREGYSRVGNVDAYIWCHHYILQGNNDNEAILRDLQSRYKTTAEVHTNSWSGLSGIVNAMHLLTAAMIIILALLVLVSVSLTASRLIRREENDMAVLRTVGFSAGRLRRGFALRFGVAVLPGALLGTLLCCLAGDPIIAVILSLFGVGSFASVFSFTGFILPGLLIVALFMLSAALCSGSIRKIEPARLLTRE